MDITELKGILINLGQVKRIVCLKHSLDWSEWEEDNDRPKPDSDGQYSMYDVYCWLGY